MDNRPKIESIDQLTMPFKGQLIRWLETYFGRAKNPGSGGASGVTALTSNDGSVTLTKTGTSYDLSDVSNLIFLSHQSVAQNATADIVFSSIPTGATGVTYSGGLLNYYYDHLLLVVSLATDDGVSTGVDLKLKWDSVTSFDYVSMVNGSVSASSLTHNATAIVIPKVLPFSNAGAAYAQLYFHFPYYSQYLGLAPHGATRTVNWHGLGNDGSGNIGLHQGVASSGSIIAGSGTTDWSSISSITLSIGSGHWEQGEANLYAIAGGTRSQAYP